MGGWFSPGTLSQQAGIELQEVTPTRKTVWTIHVQVLPDVQDLQPYPNIWHYHGYTSSESHSALCIIYNIQTSPHSCSNIHQSKFCTLLLHVHSVISLGMCCQQLKFQSLCVCTWINHQDQWPNGGVNLGDNPKVKQCNLSVITQVVNSPSLLTDRLNMLNMLNMLKGTAFRDDC